ncbi:MAG TPA: hypothetical protein VFN37_08775, partial [Candidatus Baltobacteraceae bacterium]|nr:hypothetical protein [Candidatus Baltobacteraceae bacterium]
MRISTIPAVLVAMLLLAAPALATPPPGTHLSGQIQQNISTASANVGDAVTVTNVVAPGANIHNGTMYGTVTKVVRAGQGRPAQLRITMHSLRLASGETYRVDGVVTGMTANTKSN